MYRDVRWNNSCLPASAEIDVSESASAMWCQVHQGNSTALSKPIRARSYGRRQSGIRDTHYQNPAPDVQCNQINDRDRFKVSLSTSRLWGIRNNKSDEEN